MYSNINDNKRKAFSVPLGNICTHDSEELRKKESVKLKLQCIHIGEALITLVLNGISTITVIKTKKLKNSGK